MSHKPAYFERYNKRLNKGTKEIAKPFLGQIITSQLSPIVPNRVYKALKFRITNPINFIRHIHKRVQELKQRNLVCQVVHNTVSYL